MPARPTDIVVISSHVSHGCVGNRAIAFALERLGFRVWLVPTIILPRHPGHGSVEPIALPDAAFADHLAALSALPEITNIGAVLSGYLATPAQADAVARFVAVVKAARADAVYLCDPVIGDAGALYVDEALAILLLSVIESSILCLLHNYCLWQRGQ